MTVHEYGVQNEQVILLLHGGGLSWWNYREAAQLLQDRFHVILPVLDGHAGSDCAFESIQANARRIAEYIDSHLHGHILALGGLSLGGQIAVELLAQRPQICDYALIESASLIPSKLTSLLIEPAFASSYFLIKQNWFSKLQFRSLHIQKKLYPDYYADTCRISKRDLIAFTKASTEYALPGSAAETTARVLVTVGGREQPSMKKSARLLNRALPGSGLHLAEGLYHGELSLNRPEAYAALLRNLIG